MTLSYAGAARSAYQSDAILSATPARLLTMLYDRLLLDLQRAESAQAEADWAAATPHLMHAGDIVSELASSLKPELWDGGESLLAIYAWVTSLLITANVRRSIETTRECITLLEPLRAAWHEAAAAAGAGSAIPTGGIVA